ncbi:MAG: HDOD domain-containing protein [Deltaproteobacteria bacterium]
MAELELIDQEIERVALSIGIPPCPGILLELSEETKKEEPDFAKVEKLVSRDVGLSATLLKTINSPFYGLRNKISSVSQAVGLLGLSMLSSTISGLVLRNVFSGKDQVSMERFWDSSAKFAMATTVIAKKITGLNKEDAYTYGLFQNCGIPILIQKFPDYKQTLDKANNSSEDKFTDIEDEAHGTDHATIGYLMTKSWNLPEMTINAVRFHHEYTVLSESQTKLTTESLNLVALGLLADRAVQVSSGMNFSLEWTKGGALALAQLGITDVEFGDICEEVTDLME